jgi:hypothetical protein
MVERGPTRVDSSTSSGLSRIDGMDSLLPPYVNRQARAALTPLAGGGKISKLSIRQGLVMAKVLETDIDRCDTIA